MATSAGAELSRSYQGAFKAPIPLKQFVFFSIEQLIIGTGIET